MEPITKPTRQLNRRSLWLRLRPPRSVSLFCRCTLLALSSAKEWPSEELPVDDAASFFNCSTAPELPNVLRVPAVQRESRPLPIVGFMLEESCDRQIPQRLNLWHVALPVGTHVTVRNLLQNPINGLQGVVVGHGPNDHWHLG